VPAGGDGIEFWTGKDNGFYHPLQRTMDIIDKLFGHGESITALQMSVRATIVFFITLILIRIGGVRIFGRRSAVDTIIVIIMGSVLARGIVGASPFLATLAASAAMIVIHRVLGLLSTKYRGIEITIKGNHVLLYSNGKIIAKNLEKTSLSKEDLEESLRLETKSNSLEKVETAYLETNGRISFIMKNDDGKDKR
jgi:uncharacterized membrane protein YcaP (DUF421 family)